MKIRTHHLISLQAFLFVVFLISSFFFNRFSVDDYYYIGELNNKSFSELYSDLYFEWHGRWTANFTILFFLQFYKLPYFLFLFNLISVVLLFLSTRRLFKSINSFYKLNIPKKDIIIYNVVFLSMFFFCTVNPNETWFWYTASLVYFWGIIALTLSLVVLLKDNLNFTDYLLYIVGLIYLGGAYEPLAIMLMLLFTMLLYKKVKMRLVLLGFGVILISFLINYLSPGTAFRDDITPSLSILNWILYSGYNTLKYLFSEFHFTFQIAIILSIPFYILGKQSNFNNVNFNSLRELLISILLIGLVCFINLSVAVFALGGLAPDRAGIATSFLISLILARLFFLFGNNSKSSKKVVFYVPAWGCGYLLILSIYFFGIHKEYSNAVDRRNETILLSKDNPIEVEPLPESGYLYNTEITEDATNFKNQHIKYGLGIESEIVLKPN